MRYLFIIYYDLLIQEFYMYTTLMQYVVKLHNACMHNVKCLVLCIYHHYHRQRL